MHCLHSKFQDDQIKKLHDAFFFMEVKIWGKH